MKRFSRNIAIFLIALLLVLPFASCQSSADDEQAAEEVQIAGTIQETEPAQAEEVSPVPQEESVPEEVPVSITYEYMGYELTIEAYDGYALITYPQGATEEEVAAAEADLQAAVDQLTIWAERAGVDIVKQAMGSDPASVAYDTVKSAVAKGADVVLVDTAGRLHNRVDLMNELTKIRNVIRKVVPDGPHDVMLILDASTGQNAFQQAKEFSRATDVTSLTITKLDGTAKGGVVVGVSDQFHIPVKFIGTGEGIGDLEVFNKSDFVQKLFSADDLR